MQALVLMAVVRWLIVGRRVRNWLCYVDDACSRGAELVHAAESRCNRIDSVLGKVHNLLEVHDLGAGFSARLGQIQGLFGLCLQQTIICLRELVVSFRWLVD